jgi:hypothetical protein
MDMEGDGSTLLTSKLDGLINGYVNPGFIKSVDKFGGFLPKNSDMLAFKLVLPERFIKYKQSGVGIA